MQLMKDIAWLLVWALVVALGLGATCGPALGQSRTFFDALWQVEASGQLNPEDGDGGKSIGPYQISYAYWADAEMPDGTWQDCRDKAYAERVMRRYWKRWKARTDEQRARCHNSGWNWRKKYRKTDGHWEKVKLAMKGGG